MSDTGDGDTDVDGSVDATAVSGGVTFTTRFFGMCR